MKQQCAEPNCQRPATIFTSRRDKLKREYLYCSTLCAQQDSARLSNITGSEATERSISVGLGATSVVTSSSSSTTEKEKMTLKESPTSRERRENDTLKTQKPIEQENEKDDTEELKKLDSWTENDMKKPTQPKDSENQLQTYAQEQSEQKSLIDSSIKSTHELAKYVMDEVKKHKSVDPSIVNAACNAAKQFGMLVKLKMDFHKQFGSLK